MACWYCRQRKRRCDGSKPTCGLCRAKKITCVYVNKDANLRPLRPRSLSELGNHSIQTIENLLHSQTNVLKSLQRSIRSPGSGTNVPAAFSDALNFVTTQNEPSPEFTSQELNSQIVTRHAPLSSREYCIWPETRTKSPYMREESPEFPPLTIPPGHEASSSSLLGLSEVQALVGEFPEEYFFRVESHHSETLDLRYLERTNEFTPDIPPINREAANNLVNVFFQDVHIFHPLFEPEAFYSCYETTINRGLQRDEVSAVLLLTFALGALVHERPQEDQSERGAAPHSFEYFRSAQRMLLDIWTQSVGENILLSQGLLLCALYLAYRPQPLLSMKYVHMASTSVEQLLIRSRNANPPQYRVQEIIRLSWACFIMECDVLAEFHQPRSGIQFLADRMLFPSCGTPPRLSIMYFLAEISARSLVNRIHYSINFTNSMNTYTGGGLCQPQPHDFNNVDTLSSLRNICNELTHQLETWYNSLPATIKPDLTPDTRDDNIQSCLLRCRYWSSMNKIYRPFVIKVTSMPEGAEVPHDLLEKCQTCITSCRIYLHSVRWLLIKRTPYLYTASHGAFASALILSISASSHSLREYVSDLESLQTLALDALRPWAEDGSAIESAYEILSSIRNKFRYRDPV